MSSILLLGFLLGMRHALEADHIAAVATLAARTRSTRRAMFQGAVWGLGHTATLFLVCAAALYVDAVVPQRLAQGLETAVGAMLVLLGAEVLWRLRRERVHFHAHRHRDGTTHLHAHSHAGDTAPHAPHAPHPEHEHPQGFPARALYVGLVHGLAGSAALILLTLTTVSSPSTGLFYVGLFGLGSVCGMAVLSAAIIVPLRGAQRFTWLHAGIQTMVGLATIAVGGILIYENASPLLA